jgi:hypothetical protein
MRSAISGVTPSTSSSCFADDWPRKKFHTLNAVLRSISSAFRLIRINDVVVPSDVGLEPLQQFVHTVDLLLE